MNGVVVWSLALPMAAACCLGNWMGSRMAIRVGPAAVRRFLTVSLSLLLLTLVWQYFLPRPCAKGTRAAKAGTQLNQST